MIKVAFFLHLYQPPTQFPHVLEKITDECYRPLIAMLDANPQLHLSVNMTGSLIELLARHGHTDILDQFSSLIDRGQVELIGSAAYHAFLPNLPDSVRRDQVTYQEELLKQYLHIETKPRGFFPPEMAYTHEVGKLVRELGYDYILTDERVSGQHERYTPFGQDESGLIYAMRERTLSHAIIAGLAEKSDNIINFIHRSGYKHGAILGMDGETFGHHRKGLIEEFITWSQSDKLQLCTISQLLEENKEAVEPITPHSSSWTWLDTARTYSMPFIRWDDDSNDIHKLQWQLTNLAIQEAENKDIEQLRRALFSCQYWWASARPWWDLEQVEAGAWLLLETVRSTAGAGSESANTALGLYHNIVVTAMRWVSTGKMQERVDAEHEYQYYDEVSKKVNQ